MAGKSHHDSRLASGQGREIAKGLAFQGGLCKGGDSFLESRNPHGGCSRSFVKACGMARATLALGPTRVVKTSDWIVLATSRCGQDGESRGLGPSSEAAASWNTGPGTLAPGLPSFLSVRPLLRCLFQVGKSTWHFFLIRKDDAVSVWMLSELPV